MTLKQIQKELNGTLTVAPIQDPTLIELFTKLGLEGYTLENEGVTILATLDEWCVFYSKRSRVLQCYFKGYGHCFVSCSLQDFRDLDHIYLWIEQQKLVELTEPPEDVTYEDGVERPAEKKRKWLNDEQIQEIVRLVNNGHPQAEVARMFDISNATVSYYRKKFITE